MVVHLALLMIVDDFHLIGTRIGPAKANPILVVDSDAALSTPLAA
jgi:hypothetical protein